MNKNNEHILKYQRFDNSTLIETNVCDESYAINHNSFRLCYLDFTLEDAFLMLPIQRKLPHHIFDSNSWK